jgi:hypothetical protein
MSAAAGSSLPTMSAELRGCRARRRSSPSRERGSADARVESTPDGARPRAVDGLVRAHPRVAPNGELWIGRSCSVARRTRPLGKRSARRGCRESRGCQERSHRAPATPNAGARE